MANIESVLQENRVFPPAPTSSRTRRFPAWTPTTRCAPKPNATSRGSGRGWRANTCWHKPFTQVLDETKAPFYKWFADGQLNASYNCLDAQPRRNGNADKVAIIFEADDGKVTKVTYRDLHDARVPARQRHQVARHQEGRARRSSTCRCRSRRGRDAGLRAHRRDPLGRVRRLLGQERCRSAIIDAGATLVITADEQMRGGKRHCRSSPSSTRPSRWAAAKACATSSSIERTGGAVPWDAKRDVWLHDVMGNQADDLRARMGRRRASAVHPLHVGLDRQAEGRAALHRRLPAVGRADDEVDVRHQAVGRLLVHRRRRLGHRPHLHRLRAARRPAPPRSMFEGVPTYPDAGRFWEMMPGPQGHASSTRRPPRSARSSRPTRPIRRRTRPSTTCRACASSARSASRSIRKRGCGTTTTSAAARCPIVDTFWQTETGGHMITPLPGATPLVPGSCTLPLPGHHGRDRRRDRPRRAQRAGRHAGRQAPVAVDDPHHLGRSRALQEELLPGGTRRQALPRRRRLDPRQGDRLLHDHGPHRRRAQRLGPPHGHDGDRVGAGRESAWSPKPPWSDAPTI